VRVRVKETPSLALVGAISFLALIRQLAFGDANVFPHRRTVCEKRRCSVHRRAQLVWEVLRKNE
jgi:hypothetical protein